MAQEAALTFERKTVARLRRFPREPDQFVYGLRLLVALIIRGLLRLYHRFEIVGREHLPNDESFVLVANHSSHLDTLCLLAALPLRRLHRAFPVAAEDYFFRGLPTDLVRGRGHECHAFRAANAGAGKSLHLRPAPGAARQRAHHFPGRNEIEDGRDAAIQIGYRGAAGGARCERSALLCAGRVSSMAQGAAVATAGESAPDRRNSAELCSEWRREERDQRDRKRVAACRAGIGRKPCNPLSKRCPVGTGPSCSTGPGGLKGKKQRRRCSFSIAATNTPGAGRRRSIR